MNSNKHFYFITFILIILILGTIIFQGVSSGIPILIILFYYLWRSYMILYDNPSYCDISKIQNMVKYKDNVSSSLDSLLK